MGFRELEKVGLDYTERSPFRFVNERDIAAPPAQVFAVLAGDSWPQWFPDFLGVTWLSGTGGLGSVREVRLKTLSVRETFLAWDDGRRYCFRIDSVTLPLIRIMVEDLALSPGPDGGTHLRWTAHYTPRLLMRIIHPIARLIFGRMFRKAADGLKKQAELIAGGG